MAAPSPSRRPAKKVRPPPKANVSDDALQDTLARLSRAIEEIQHKNASKLSFEEHYRYSYNLCLNRKYQLLYDTVTKLVVAHLETEARERIEPAFPTSSLLTASSAVGTSSAAASTSESATNGLSSNAANNRVAQSMEGANFLGALKGTWEDHKMCMAKLRDVLSYLDKVYTTTHNLAPTYQLGLHLFLETLLRNKARPIQSNVLSVSLSLIRIERDGETVDRDLLKTTIDMLSDLREVSNDGMKGKGESVFKTWWEAEFLKDTKAYYTTEAELNLERLSCPEFLAKVERRLDEETNRSARYLNDGTGKLLLSVLDHVLIENTLQSLIDHPNLGLPALLNEDRVHDLKRMYTVFGRVGAGHPALMRGIKAWLVEQGAKIVETASSGAGPSTSAKAATGEAPTNDMAEDELAASASPAKDKGKGRAVDPTAPKQPAAGTAAAANNVAIEWVHAVLELKDKMDNLWREAFAKDRSVQNAINDAFETFINQVRKSPEYISIFLDENLKKGLKGKNESEVDAILDKTIVLFRFLNDKDVFEDYYKRHLARRLYLGRSLSDDAERTMLQKLKLECGASFVAKLEGMLKDVGLSEQLNTGYKRYLDGLDSDRPSTELHVQVCTSSFWPNTPDVPCILPQDFQRLTKSFERYFNTRFTGRKLSWHAEHGNVDVRVRFDKGPPKELNLATFGYVVLAQFADLPKGAEQSYEDLVAKTGIPESHLKRTLQSLACAKYKILKKEPATRNVSAGDKFSFNHSFTDKLVRIKIQTIANRVETAEESRVTDTRLEAERGLIIDAIIVRVMKNRKQLGIQELVQETVNQLQRRFQPKPVAIKLAIEKLIEKEYLERDENDRKVLRYLA